MPVVYFLSCPWKNTGINPFFTPNGKTWLLLERKVFLKYLDIYLVNWLHFSHRFSQSQDYILKREEWLLFFINADKNKIGGQKRIPLTLKSWRKQKQVSKMPRTLKCWKSAKQENSFYIWVPNYHETHHPWILMKHWDISELPTCKNLNNATKKLLKLLLDDRSWFNMVPILFPTTIWLPQGL